MCKRKTWQVEEEGHWSEAWPRKIKSNKANADLSIIMLT